LFDPAAPEVVRKWVSQLPDRIEVRAAAVGDDDMTHLDPGERAAIALAQSKPGALLLIDETAGPWKPSTTSGPMFSSIRRRKSSGFTP
jgi:hypothetical protein